MTDKTIFIFDAQEGDKLADDVHTPDGNILAKKDTILNYDIIANISGHHILEVKVYDTNNERQPPKPAHYSLLYQSRSSAPVSIFFPFSSTPSFILFHNTSSSNFFNFL